MFGSRQRVTGRELITRDDGHVELRIHSENQQHQRLCPSCGAEARPYAVEVRDDGRLFVLRNTEHARDCAIMTTALRAAVRQPPDEGET